MNTIFNKISLDELVEVKSGSPSLKDAKDEAQGEIEFKSISIKDISLDDVYLDIEKCNSSYTNDEDYIKKYQIKKGDVLITAKGAYIRATVYESSSLPVLPTTNLFILRVKGEGLMPEYLSLFLNQEATIETLKSKLSGTSVMALSRKDLLSLELRIPPLAEQEKLVEFVSSGKTYINERRAEIDNMQGLLGAVLFKNIYGGKSI